MKPLISIVIPAYNAEKTISESIQSAVAQTWQRTEIIVVNDGSTDRTPEIAQQFASKGVKVVTTENRGLSAAVNEGIRHSQGDYLQELDADDLLSRDKIERQMEQLREGDSKRVLLSSPWAYFYYRPQRARFVKTAFWQDQSPVEWLLRKMGENLHMQNATWLTSRELAEAAGPWNESLVYDQDGEYFLRVVAASERIRFVPEGRIYYRASGSSRISYIGTSMAKRRSMMISMKAHIACLRSLEESERVRQACLRYIETWYPVFCETDSGGVVEELKNMAAELDGRLKPPRLPAKYRWMVPLIGTAATRVAARELKRLKADASRSWDRAMHAIERRSPSVTHRGNASSKCT